MVVSIIAAIGENNEIGRDNRLLCHLPSDLKHFKEITEGHAVVMGRKTFDSLPKGALPRRRNVVISRDSRLLIKDAEVYASLDEAWEHLAGEKEVFVIGGAQLYAQTLACAGKLYLTQIHTDFPEATVFFPPLHAQDWKEIKREMHPADDKHPYSFSFVEYERIS
ncbi:MAG: dihydrofolate reductase [Candidatus Azobacteroides sp.]|nr:dihydrofolate reductase [Candidatus Azobacteroides sp.]